MYYDSGAEPSALGREEDLEGRSPGGRAAPAGRKCGAQRKCGGRKWRPEAEVGSGAGAVVSAPGAREIARAGRKRPRALRSAACCRPPLQLAGFNYAGSYKSPSLWGESVNARLRWRSGNWMKDGRETFSFSKEAENGSTHASCSDSQMPLVPGLIEFYEVAISHLTACWVDCLFK